jgi:SPP1 family predicted phage head-tail adaptor
LKDRKIIVQRNTTSKDDHGGVVNSWSNYQTMKAEVAFLPGSEVFEGMAQSAKTKVSFLVWWVDGKDVTEKDRIVFEGKNYSIRSIQEVTRRKEIKFIAEWQEKTG